MIVDASRFFQAGKVFFVAGYMNVRLKIITMNRLIIVSILLNLFSIEFSSCSFFNLNGLLVKLNCFIG